MTVLASHDLLLGKGANCLFSATMETIIEASSERTASYSSASTLGTELATSK